MNCRDGEDLSLNIDTGEEMNCRDGEDLSLNIDTGEDANGEILTMISYNILQGMKNDQANNYDNFVAWIKSYDPDILALQEANGFTQETLTALAARYNHPYVVTNVKIGDNYPVALTSKFPIEVRRKITKNVSHGAIFARIKDVNVVVTHLWPQAYWHTVGDGLGDAYRLQEINIVLDSTIRKYPQEPKWIMCGDFNSVSRKDYAPETGSTNNFDVHDGIVSAGYIDVLHYLYGCKSAGLQAYPGQYPGTRIDFWYGSGAVLRNSVFSKFIYDDFTEDHSDHRPVLVKFRY